MEVEHETDEKTLISIIVPVYNIPIEYIDQCVTSILTQTYENFEVFIIDDGSEEMYSKRCDYWGERDTRIKVIHQQNQGVSVARNQGLEASSGEYIAFVDSDDWLENVYLERLLNIAKSYNSDLVACSCWFVSNKKKSVNDFYSCDINLCDSHQLSELRNQLICRGLTDYYPPMINIGVPWGKLYRKEYLDDRCFRFKAGVRRMQDNLFNLYVFEYTDRISYIKEPLYYYRDFSSSACRKYNPNIVSDFTPFLNELEIFVNQYRKDMQGVYKRNFTSINSYLSSYFFHPENNKSFNEKATELNTLLNNQQYAISIKQVKGNLLSTTEKVFLFALRHRNYRLLFILHKGNAMLNRMRFKE